MQSVILWMRRILGAALPDPSVRHPVEREINFEGGGGNFHISEISTSKNVCGVVD
jgi:hypothetical protein